MKIEELRVGNVYQYFGNDRICYVEQMIKDYGWQGGHKVISTCGQITAICACRGIPLTEEILLKCGFEYSCYGGLLLRYIWEKTDITLRISVRKGVIKSFLCENEIDLKYIHELQNIYYSITKEELDIKL